MSKIGSLLVLCSKVLRSALIAIGLAWAFAPVLLAQSTGLAQLTSPADGATDVDPAVNFTWTNILDGELYQLSLSTIQPGGNDAYHSDELPNVSSLAEVHVLPNTFYYYDYRTFTPPSLKPQTKYYARLWTVKAGIWNSVDSTFTTGYGIARLTSSTNWNGAGAVGPTTTFTWNSIADASGPTPYYLYLGTQPGQLSGGVCTAANACVWQTGATSATSATVPAGVLQPNTSYYVSLWTKKNGAALLHADSAFSTGSFTASSPTLSRIIYPADGATHVDPFAPVQWTTLPLPQGSKPPLQYFLYIGDGTSGTHLGNYVHLGHTTGTSWEGGLIGGQKYYATIYTFTTDSGCPTGCWFANQTSFTTATLAIPTSASTFYSNIATATATVRDMATGQYNTPSKDKPIAHTFLSNNVNPNHSEKGVALCSDFANNLMVQLHKQGIVAHRRDAVFGGGPEAHSSVEYYDPFANKWATTDATFGMMFYDSSKTPANMSMDEIADALAQGVVSTIPNTFITSTSITPNCPQCFGSYWDLNALFDPMLYYLNPLGIDPVYLDSKETTNEPNDPRNFMLNITNPVGVAATYVFSFAKATDKVVIQEGDTRMSVKPQPSTAPVGAPLNFGNFSHPTPLDSGWSYVGSRPAGMTVKRLVCPLYIGPTCP